MAWNGPQSVIGEWVEPYVSKAGPLNPSRLRPGGLEFWHREGQSPKDDADRRDHAIETERKRLLEFLKDEIFEWVCEDGYSWQEKCPACDARDKLRRKGLSEERIEEILSFKDADNVKLGDRRGSRDVNILLNIEGLGKWAGTNKLIATQMARAAEGGHAVGGD